MFREEFGVSREFRIDHDKLSNPQTVSKVMDRAYQEQGLNKQVNIPLDVIDDPSKRQRIVRVKNTKYFDFGRRG